MVDKVWQLDEGLLAANRSDDALRQRNRHLEHDLAAANERAVVLRAELTRDDRELAAAKASEEAERHKAMVAEAYAAATNGTAVARREKLVSERHRSAWLAA